MLRFARLRSPVDVKCGHIYMTRVSEKWVRVRVVGRAPDICGVAAFDVERDPSAGSRIGARRWAELRGSPAAAPTSEQLCALWDACVAWRDEHRVICAESVYQTDHVNLACPELATAVCNVIGYAETEDE